MVFQIVSNDTGCSIAGDYATLEIARAAAISLHGSDADMNVFISDTEGSDGQIPVVSIPVEALSPGSKLWYYPYRDVIAERRGGFYAFNTDILQWQEADHEDEETLLDDGYQEVSRDFLRTDANLDNREETSLYMHGYLDFKEDMEG